MKTFVKTYLPYIIIAVLLVLFWVNGCQRGDDDGIVTVPPVDGEFKPQKPVYIKGDTVYVTKWKTRTDTIIVETPNPVNDSLAVAYQKAKDSLERYKMFLDAIQIRNFENIFEDEYLKLTVTGEVQGHLNWLKPEYHIKEREVQVPVTRLRLLAGAEVGTDLNDFRYKLNLGIQNREGNIYKLGYAREGMNDVFWLGYEMSVLNFKW